MITDGGNLILNNKIVLWRGITPNFNDGYSEINCLHSFRKNKLKLHENVCKSHDYCHFKMPEEYNNILKYNQDDESMKIPFVIYANMELLLKENTNIG